MSRRTANGNTLMYFCGLGLAALGAAGMLKCGKKQEEYTESCFLAGVSTEPDADRENRM